MADNPIDLVMSRIEAATVKNGICNGPFEANAIVNEEDVKPVIIEAIAIKSLNPQFDTSPLFTEIAKASEHWAECTGRKIAPLEFDKIIGQAVREIKEEQLLGFSSKTGRTR